MRIAVGTVTGIETARRRRVVSRFCTECKTPWSLTGVRRHNGYVVICKHCGHVRATIPSQRLDGSS
jgi:RNase P subunit RPR2